jgi:hypothetical protein
MLKIRSLRRGFLSHVQSDARVSLAAMPITPVALDLAQPHGELVDRRLDLLQAQDIGLLAGDELLELRFPRAKLR